MHKKNILVIAAHPDDEVLGCGATIAKHCKNGDEVHILILAEGERSRGLENLSSRLSKLQGDCIRANKLLGVAEQNISFASFPDNQMDTRCLLDIVKCVEDVKRKVNPDVVYTHFSGDLNVDHRITFQAVMTAFRPLPNEKPVKILSFEILSSTEWNVEKSFQPNWFVNIKDYLGIKLEALKHYEAEMRPWPHSRSYKAVESLSQYRGVSAGVENAEAFILHRYIDK